MMSVTLIGDNVIVVGYKPSRTVLGLTTINIKARNVSIPLVQPFTDKVAS